MKKYFFVLFIFIGFTAFSQQKQPKIVVGIVVDQMRYDYLNRYWNKFGNDGFKKLVSNGFN